MKLVENGNCVLAVDDGGTGAKTPVVFIHALGGNMSHWDHFVPVLRNERRVIRYDIRGHGRSTLPADMDFSVEAYASEIGSVLDALRLPHAILIGHSLSGAAAFAYASQHPERIPAFIALDPIMDRSAHGDDTRKFSERLFTEEYPAILPDFWRQLAGSNLDVSQRLLADVSSTPQQVIAQSFRELLEFDAKSYSGRFKGASLSIVTPSNDNPASLHRIPPGFSHSTVHESGHWVHLEKPGEVTTLMNQFLRHAEALPVTKGP